MKAVSLPQFQRDTKCKSCDLHEGATSVCVPCRPMWETEGCDTALLVVGEAPGYHEDLQDKNFVGKSGELLHLWINNCQLRGTVDVFLANVVRCRPPGNADPLQSQVKACAPYLLGDLDVLSEMYGRVIILTVGAAPTRALTGLSLTKSFVRQSEAVSIGGTDYPLFSTYHPAYTLPGRNPAATDAVMDHLDLLCRFINGEELQEVDDSYDVRLCPDLPTHAIDTLAVDCETYGIDSRLPEQTQFLPPRSMCSDKPHPRDLVLIVTVAWHNLSGGVESGAFVLHDSRHRERVQAFLDKARVLVYKNAQFDLPYLRATGFKLDHHKHVEDVDVWNYLYSDVRPERSLKALGPLLGLANYEDGGFKRYDDPYCPEALEYAVKDAVDTLKCRDSLRTHIRDRYGCASPKLSQFTNQWYSDLIWLCVYMSETGVPMDRRHLVKFRSALRTRLARLTKFRGEPIRGTGSAAVVQSWIDRAADRAGVLDPMHPELELTPKTKEIATKEQNLNLILAHLEQDDVHYEAIVKIREMRGTQKLLGTYVRPIIGPFKTERGRPVQDSYALPTERASVGIVHPRWFPVPSPYQKDDDISGTKQGRITCKGPALQTMPKSMKEMTTTVHSPGYCMSIDLSQIELRVAALISGDPDMRREYIEGIDRHWDRAIEFFDGEPCTTHITDLDKECPECYQARHTGKTGNFLIIYYGSDHRLRQTLREEVGLDTTMEWCSTVVRKARARYPKYMAFAIRLIDTVHRKGHWEDPILGGGRVFTKSRRTNWLDKSTILNLPIQYTAANILLAGQMPLSFALIDEGMKSRVNMNTYDSLDLQGPKEELDTARSMAYDFLRGSEYFKRVCDHYEWDLPLEAEDEVKEVAHEGTHDGVHQ